MRVLIVRVSSMGDLVHTLPALSDAARAFPGITFDWIVEESFAQIPAWHRNVDKVIPSAFRRWPKNWSGAFKAREPQNFLKQVRADKYDSIVDVQCELKSAFASRLAKGRRYGYDRRTVHEWGAQFLYQKKFFVPKNQHSLQRMRQLLSQSLGYEYNEADLDYGIVRSRLQRVDLDLPEKFVVFIHSTSWTSKVWPDFYWHDLLRKVTSSGYSVVLPWGDEAERQRALKIADGNPRALVLPPLSISEKASIIEQASATVGLDTGLSHIAAALDIPSITIYGATDPRYVGALGQNQIHLASNFECVGCHEVQCGYEGQAEFKPACLVEISPQLVWQQLQGILNARIPELSISKV